jgi:hypothetical protein
MKEAKARAYEVLGKINTYVKEYGDVLDKPRRKYMRDMILGSIRSNTLILSQIAQKVQQITDKCSNSHQTEKRLSYNLNSEKWSIMEMRDIHYQSMLEYVTDDTLIILDLSDIQKPYGRKLPDLKDVRDGSTGSVGLGYHLVSGLLRLNKRMIYPLWLDSFSTDEVGFKSQNVEIMDVVKSIFSVTGYRGILVYDSYLDIGHIFADLLDMHIRFVIRLKGNRMMNFQTQEDVVKAIVDDYMKTQKLRYSTRIPVKKPRIHGKKYWKLSYDYYPVTLPGRDDDQLYLVVARREGKSEPIYLLVSIPITCARDALRWIKGYFSRWGIEDTFRFWKQKFGIEDIRTTDIGNFKKLLWIAVVAFAFMTIHLLTDLKLRKGLIGLTHRARLAKNIAFLYYRLQKGVDKLFEVFSSDLLEINWST